MRWWVQLIALLTLPVCIHGQIAINKLNFSFDYNNLRVPNFINSSERTQYAGQFEYVISDMFSAEVYGVRDLDGYSPYRNAMLGDGVKGLNPMYKWSDKNCILYGGLRVYPYEQWRSMDPEIRYKDAKGFYFAFGYGGEWYTRRNYHFEVHQRSLVDSLGIPQTVIDSSFVHYNTYHIFQRGVQFGFGYKLFQSKLMYTDVGLYSNAYMRNNRNVQGYYVKDSDGGTYYTPEEWEYVLNVIEEWAKNGRGFWVRMSVGINLDIRK